MEAAELNLIREDALSRGTTMGVTLKSKWWCNNALPEKHALIIKSQINLLRIGDCSGNYVLLVIIKLREVTT
jgi:hypothetical protein